MDTMIATNDPIIMVDDSETDQLIAKRCYQKSILQNPFLTFFDGPTFLSHMDSVLHKEAPIPALVLLDLNMPIMNGFEVLTSIRQHQVFTHVPILLMFSNSDNPKDTERSIALGANGFQVKPTHVADFVAFFNSLKG
ncbi:MAG: response regulator [Nitrospirales bacterium]|nr:MAG: response regulator [Nitrospirales bacterium]